MRIGVLALLLIVQIAEAQHVSYDVVLTGRTIGSVRVMAPEKEGDYQIRRIEADFQVPFYSGSFVSENKSTEGLLSAAKTEHFLNGQRKELTTTRRIGGEQYTYGVSRKPGSTAESRQIALPEGRTMTALYYGEPVGWTQVYSERFGKVCRIRHAGDGRYIVALPDGKESVYSYKAGQCVTIVTELAGFKLRIVRSDLRLARN